MGKETWKPMKLKLVERVGVIAAFQQVQAYKQQLAVAEQQLRDVMLDCGLDPSRPYTFTGDGEVVEQPVPGQEEING